MIARNQIGAKFDYCLPDLLAAKLLSENEIIPKLAMGIITQPHPWHPNMIHSKKLLPNHPKKKIENLRAMSYPRLNIIDQMTYMYFEDDRPFDTKP